jgi:membrane protein insertase Oxa1/YidC/SpoIIIJ
MSSSAILELSSSCFKGLAKISTIEKSVIIHTSSVNLETYKKNFTIHFSTSKQMNDFDLLVTGSKSTISMNVKFAAVETQTVNNQTGYVIVPDRGDSDAVSVFDGFFNFFDDIFLGIASWWQYVVFVVIIIIVIIVSIALFPLLIPLIRAVFKLLTCQPCRKSKKV